MKRVLVIGGTGAIGRYTVNELLNTGYAVDVIALDKPESNNKNLRYTVGPGKNVKYIKKILEENRYDGIIDFMVYSTAEFAERIGIFLENTAHYIFLSSYRVYADCDFITESSPRLLDVSDNEEYLKTEDYSLYKARCENILLMSKYKNYTIVRPSITYSKRRFQLVTLESNILIPRTLAGKEILLPENALGCNTCMTWAADTGKMLARLIFNERAYGETFTLSTAECHPWSYVRDCYTDIIGSKFKTVDAETYLHAISSYDYVRPGVRWQLELDRLYNRRIDNSKLLSVTGIEQKELMPLYDGLKLELTCEDLSKIEFPPHEQINKKMDMVILGENIIKGENNESNTCK